MGRLCRRVIARYDRLRDDDEDEERVVSFLLESDRLLYLGLRWACRRIICDMVLYALCIRKIAQQY